MRTKQFHAARLVYYRLLVDSQSVTPQPHRSRRESERVGGAEDERDGATLTAGESVVRGDVQCRPEREHFFRSARV